MSIDFKLLFHYPKMCLHFMLNRHIFSLNILYFKFTSDPNYSTYGTIFFLNILFTDAVLDVLQIKILNSMKLSCKILVKRQMVGFVQ